MESANVIARVGLCNYVITKGMRSGELCPNKTIGGDKYCKLCSRKPTVVYENHPEKKIEDQIKLKERAESERRWVRKFDTEEVFLLT